jgi:hypothetical protein
MTNFDKYTDYIDALDDEEAISALSAPLLQREVIVDSKTGLPRQAGSTLPEGEFIRRLKIRAEGDLYVFSKAIVGRDYLTKDLHVPVCNFLQQVPPFRKMLLLPRRHAKTSIVAHCLPAHIVIQPAHRNIYFPKLKFAGTENRILLCGETEGMASKNLRVVQSIFEGNEIFRALWPHCCWEKSRRQSKKWNNLEMIVPRGTEWPDPTVRAIGVGGAITGARPTVLIKDDLVSIEAANSEVVMQTAIDWHIASRALMEEYEKNTGMEALEFVIGTRWAVWDLYQYILDNDPTVETVIRAIIENELPIWPEHFDFDRIDQLKKEFGSLFWLLYMNSAANPELTDFDVDKIRSYELKGDQLIFDSNEDDVLLEKKWEKQPLEQGVKLERGTEWNKHTWDALIGKGRGDYFRVKYG